MAADIIAASTRMSMSAFAPLKSVNKRSIIWDHLGIRVVIGEESHHDRIGLQHADQSSALHREVDLGEQDLSSTQIALLRLGGADRGIQPFQSGLGHREDDVVLRLELIVDSGFRHTEGVGDHLQRRPADTMLG